MRYFLDTEFIERSGKIDLISIGIVSETGATYSAISSEYSASQASAWVIENVIIPLYESQDPKVKDRSTMMSFHKVVGIPLSKIKEEIKQFVGCPEYPEGDPEFWGYYADYDWVVFCGIFGRMVDLPEGFPYYCRDLIQVLEMFKLEKLAPPMGEHDALVDAEWNRQLYNSIKHVFPSGG